MYKYINALNRSDKKIVLHCIMLSTFITMIIPPLASMNSFGAIFAQEDNNNNNAIGQDGDGNEASQIEDNSQETEQNIMCVSGDSISLSCDNLSYENIGGVTIGEGQDGDQGPSSEQGQQLSLAGKIYTVEGDLVDEEQRAVSTAKCDSGDSLIGGSFLTQDVNNILVPGFPSTHLYSYGNFSSNEWIVEIKRFEDSIVRAQAIATCFDNP